MSILPGSSASRRTPNAADPARLARLAVLLTSAPMAMVLANAATGEHRTDGSRGDVGTGEHDDALAELRSLCEQTASDGVLRVVGGDDRAAYICVPLRGDGERARETVGAICVVDPTPRTWTEEQVAGLIDLAELAAAGLALRDVAAAREQARAEVAREHAFLNAVLEHLTDGVAACDQDGTLVYFNPALRDIHGLPERTLAADEWASAYDLYDGDGTRLLRPDEIPLARAFAGEKVDAQRMVVMVEGRDPQHFLATGAPILDEYGRKLGAVISMHDVSADHRRRTIRRAHLAIATALAANPGGDEAVATAMLHLRTALDPAAAGVIMAGQTPDHDIDARVVQAVMRSGVPMQASLSAPYAGCVACAPVVVAGSTVGVLYVAGPSRNLLDDLTASIVDGVAGLLGRCLERERADRLDRELRATRHELERVIRHAQDYVWTVEFLPSGRTSMRASTSPREILGGADVPADGSWLDELQARIDPEDLPEMRRWREGLLRGRPGEVTCRVQGDDGVVRRIRTRCSVRSEDGRRFVDGVSSDVTGRARFEVVRESTTVVAPVSP